MVLGNAHVPPFLASSICCVRPRGGGTGDSITAGAAWEPLCNNGPPRGFHGFCRVTQDCMGSDRERVWLVKYVSFQTQTADTRKGSKRKETHGPSRPRHMLLTMYPLMPLQSHQLASTIKRACALRTQVRGRSDCAASFVFFVTPPPSLWVSLLIASISTTC